MANMVTVNVYVKFNYDRLRIDKALDNFGHNKNNNNRKNKNNVRRALGTLSGFKSGEL